MRTIVTPEQMRALEREEIEHFGVPSLVLMDRAARAVAQETLRVWKRGWALVLCGPGNNGGDGYWAALWLARANRPVRVLALAPARGDGAIACEALRRQGTPLLQHLPDLAGCGVVVDALFGTGFHGALKGTYLEAVQAVNASGIPIVAVDIPSGVDGATGQCAGEAVRADRTVTFAQEKVGHLLFPGRALSGAVTVADIGLPDAEGEIQLVEPEDLYRSFLKPRPLDAHKGTFGHAALAAGSRGMAGAAVLAALGALNGGAGLVSVACPEHSVLPVVQQNAFEAMAWPLREDAAGGVDGANDLSAFLKGKTALGMGCGLGRGPGARALVQALARSDLPMVMDADALNVCDGVFGKNAVLTPHPGEMARLNGLRVEQITADPIGAARAFACAQGVVVLLKGATTVIAAPDGRVRLCTAGSPAMSTGGSGDVLTGLITALLAQGLSPFDAAAAGACLHGMAGRAAGEEWGEESVTARQIALCLGKAFRQARALAELPSCPT